jgi:peptide/nickel transport system permease protein
MNANKPPNAEHWFGTDLYGRDILSRIIYGARYSLMIGLSASLLGTLTGVILGLISGYFAGMVETLILRFCDVIQSIPNMLLCIVVSQALGRGLFPTVVALSFYSLPTTTRLLRSVILSQREQEYIEAARVINCSHLRILVSHLLPNCMSPIIVGFSGTIGHKILSSAGLSFLGLGIQEPIAEWGAMLSAGRSQLRYAPHAVFFPGIFVALVVLSFNLIGDCLRDSLDPKLRQ